MNRASRWLRWKAPSPSPDLADLVNDNVVYHSRDLWYEGSEMTSDQLPAIIRPGALAASDDIHLVPALIADAGDQAAWRYLEFFAANIRNPNTRRAYARACQQFFAWCDERGLTLTTIRAVDVAQLHRNPPADAFGAGREAAARRRADAVRLADHRPDRSAESGRGRARTEARRQDRQDAGARGQGVAHAHREHSDRNLARPTRSRAHRHPHLFLCPHHRSAAHEGRGSSAKGRRLAGAASREGRQAARDALSSFARGDTAALTSTPPASRTIAKAGSFEPVRGTTPCRSSTLQCPRPTPGA